MENKIDLYYLGNGNYIDNRVYQAAFQEFLRRNDGYIPYVFERSRDVTVNISNSDTYTLKYFKTK